MKTKIQKLISQIEEADTHGLFTIEHEDGFIRINYEYSLHFADKAIGYTLEEWAEDFPETFNLDGEIEIEYDPETGNILSHESRVDVYDCQVMKGQGSWDGYQFDNQIKRPEDKKIIVYLEDFFYEVNAISKKYSSPEKIEILFEGETHPTNDYHNTYFKIGRKNDKLFYHESTNHVRHNEHDYYGRAEWTPLDDFEENHDSQEIIEVFGEYFGKKLTDVLKKAGN